MAGEGAVAVRSVRATTNAPSSVLPAARRARKHPAAEKTKAPETRPTVECDHGTVA
jgi:hypothetical protein